MSEHRRGRGRGRGGHQKATPQINMSDDEESPTRNEAPAQAPSEPATKQRRQPAKSIDDLRRIMDVVHSRISVIIDTLEGDDSEASLKRNVSTAVKHLKLINTMLS